MWGGTYLLATARPRGPDAHRAACAAEGDKWQLPDPTWGRAVCGVTLAWPAPAARCQDTGTVVGSAERAPPVSTSAGADTRVESPVPDSAAPATGTEVTEVTEAGDEAAPIP